MTPTTRTPAENVLAALFGEAWAITEEAHRALVAIAARAHDAAALGGVEAVEARLGRPLDHTHAVEIRDGVATIPVQGPLVRYASMFTRISGATSYATLATDLTAALENPDVGAILLHIDSPGGAVTGLSELAALVHQARGVKPITAHVAGLGASAAYWLASAADEVTTADTAMLGSIGVVMTVPGATPPRPGQAPEYEIVSSSSPNKRLDPATDAGRAALQATADALGDVFVAAVARHRGVAVETVLAEFGRGGVFVGEAAVAAGLADAVGTYESVHAALAAQVAAQRAGGILAVARPTSLPSLPVTTRAQTVGAAAAGAGPEAGADTALAPTPAPVAPAPAPTEPLTAAQTAAAVPADAAAQLRAEGAAAERARLTALDELAVAGAESIIAEAKADATATPEATALRILRAQRDGTLRAAVATPAPTAGNAAHLAALAADEAALPTITPLHPDAAPAAQGATGPAGEAQRILAIHRAVTPTSAPHTAPTRSA